MKKIEFELDEDSYNDIVKAVGEDKVAEFCRTAAIGKLRLRGAIIGAWKIGERKDDGDKTPSLSIKD